MAKAKGRTLGSVQLRHVDTNEILMIPMPSDDPNDPLTWSAPFRYYICIITCMAVFISQFLAAGPSVAMLQIVQQIFGVTPADPTFVTKVSAAAYFFSTFAFAQGISNLFFMPLIIKYGRRPIYLISFAIYLAAAIWCANANQYANLLAARIVLGFASGSADCLAPLTIADVTFLHERGFVMSVYSACLSSGVAFGILITGFVSANHSWRIINYIVAGMTGALLLAVFFSMPETAYQRESAASGEQQILGVKDSDDASTAEKGAASASHVSRPPTAADESTVKTKETYGQMLRVFRPALTQESLIKMFFRPIPLFALPPVCFATLVMSISIGAFVAITSHWSTAYSTAYGFNNQQLGCIFLSVVVGSVTGIIGGGWLCDAVANWMTSRNGGLREPEMRLPTLSISMVAMPLGCMLYAAGFDKGYHWIVPTIGLSLVGFVITQSANIVLTYVIDAYRPIAGEAVVVQLSFKAAFGFLVSFYFNPWIQKSGIMTVMATLSGLNFAIFALWIPLLIWGSKIRHESINWFFIKKLVDWDEDREVGE